MDEGQTSGGPRTGALQRTENVGIEDEGAPDTVVVPQRPVQGGVVVGTQVAAEPDENG